jgi:fructose-1,6-bisphosphatase II
MLPPMSVPNSTTVPRADVSTRDGGRATGSANVVAAIERTVAATTRAAALACRPWVGRGDKSAADAAATSAVLEGLDGAPGTGIVVIGEGEKDEAPMLYNGERVGDGAGPEFEIAVDPLECTDNCADGLPGALATIAVAGSGTLWSPGPGFNMDKLVVGAAARDAIDIREGPEANLERIAAALHRTVEELRVIILDKSRNAELVARVRETGAAVSTPTQGDVAGALAALLPDGVADVLMGVGGIPEGVLTACAVRALRGAMQWRLAPQGEEEERALVAAGAHLEPVAFEFDDLARGETLFAATGVTDGALLRGPWESDGATFTESILATAGNVRRVVENSIEQPNACPSDGG